ncbi:leucine-rich repeat protein, partial [Clostridium sp. AM58-1XD]|uniref:leucine-rich repeat protein n=1 Tax=Clostridium sp. AM58-1XD TaxID=2292307 RepID=UPI001FA8C182
MKVLLGGARVYTINDRFTVDHFTYKELGPDTVQLIEYDRRNTTGTLTIPSSVTKPSNGRAYMVVSIGDSAFSGCSGFTGGLILPDTITQIGDFAFSGCSGFT